MEVQLFLLLLVVNLVRKSFALNISVVPSLPSGGQCSSTANGTMVMCESLDEAIQFSLTTTEDSATVSEPVAIVLPPGTHRIVSPAHFGSRSVAIVGIENMVTVKCEYEADPSLVDSDSIHTWFFNHSHSVSMRNVVFESCGFPFRFFTVRNVEVRHCSFFNFQEAVLDIYNCQSVTLDHLNLQNNSGNGRLLESNRGNTGGVAFGYEGIPSDYVNPVLTLSNSNFSDNRALGFLTPERAVTGNVYLGRGGGVGLFMNEAGHNLYIEITNCSFMSNQARLFGGGLFILTTSYVEIQHQVFVTGCHFEGNTAMSGGSGVQLSFLRSGNTSNPHRVVFSDSQFIRNRSPSGGGVYVFVSDDGNYVQFNRCQFVENSGLGSQNDLGAAIALSYLGLFSQRVASTRHEIIDCSFIGNNGPNGIVSVGYAPILLSGKNEFIQNSGASLRVIGSLIRFDGLIEFKKNLVMGEGALHLLSFGQMQLNAGTSLSFEENIGRLGSCIVIDSPATLDAFSDVLFNPRCFINYQDRFVAPTLWRNVSISFNMNRAVVSSGLYLSQNSNECSWYKYTPPFFNRTFLLDWPLWNYNNNVATGHPDFMNQNFIFGTTANRLLSNTSSVYAWPGQRVDLFLLALDGYGHHTSVNARFIFRPSKGVSSNSVIIQPQIAVFSESVVNGLLKEKYTFVYSVDSINFLQHEQLGTVITEEAFNEHPVFSNNFGLFPLPCPGGYQLNNDSGSLKCSCVDYINEIIFCEEDQDSVIIQHGTWAALNPHDTLDSSSVNLFFHPCPAGYCGCTFDSSLGGNSSSTKTCVYQYRNSNPNYQCTCDREGVLCGSCRNGTGVSVLFNKCGSCSDGFLGLIPAIILAIAVVVVVIIFIDRPVPALVMPFLFYLQTAPYAARFFPETFDIAGRYLHYLSSASGLYFIYDFCLSNHLTMTLSYLLHYIPVLVTSFTYFIVWLLWRRVFRKKSLKNHGAWWLILLLYSPMTYTSFSILNCPAITVNGTSDNYFAVVDTSNGVELELRWFWNGDIRCFTGGHIGLGLIAIAMSCLSALFIILVTALPYTKLNFSKHFVEPFATHYKSDLKFWYGVELARRMFICIALVPLPRNTVFILLVVLISLSIYTYCFPYKSIAANILEVIFHLNLLALLLLEAMPQIKQDLFVFPVHATGDECKNGFDSVSRVVYLLGTVFYLPVLIMVAAVVLVILYSILRKRIDETRSQQVVVVSDTDCAHQEEYTTQEFNIDYSMDMD